MQKEYVFEKITNFENCTSRGVSSSVTQFHTQFKLDRMGPIERMGGMVGGYGRYGPYPGRGGMAGRPHRPFTDHAGGPGAYFTVFNVKK